MSSSKHAAIIPLKHIQESTNNFAAENLIGEGGFGKVYKGKLFWSGELINIAARKLHRDYGQGDLEFWHEISMLSNLEHDNLVSFIGYCDERGEKIIVNKYEANESLDKYINDYSKLTWTQRLQICVKIARALSYLQDGEGHDSSIIHRNIKSSKILLDQNWEPKLSGFGVSKENTRVRKNRLLLAEVVGTLGYVDPTYEKTGFVTHKSDVYSFGVLMFEMLSGRRAFVPDAQREEDSPQFLVEKSSSTNAMVPLKSRAEQPPYERQAGPSTGAEGLPKSSAYIGGQPPSISNAEGLSKSSAYIGGQPPSISNAEVLSKSSVYIGGQPPSISNAEVLSKSSVYIGGKPSSISSAEVLPIDCQPPSFNSGGGGPNSFVDGQPTSFGRGETPPSSKDRPLSFGSISKLNLPGDSQTTWRKMKTSTI